MKDFLRILSKYSKQNHKSFNDFCDPLFSSFGLNHFCYYKITENGFYTTLSSNLEYSEFFFSENLHLRSPYLLSPENYQNGILLAHNIPDHSFQQSQTCTADKFKVSLVLSLMERNEKGIQGYAVGAHPKYKQIDTLLINELPLFFLFIRRFKEKFKNIFNKMDDDLVDLGTAVGESFSKRKGQFSTKSPLRLEFLEKMGYPSSSHLSRREKEILSLLKFGYPTPQIAKVLHLSPRTIESHIILLRDKFHCSYKYELHKIAQELFSFGYFNEGRMES